MAEKGIIELRMQTRYTNSIKHLREKTASQ